MPELRAVIEGTETKIYFKATICRKCVLAVPLTVEVGLTKFGNREEALKHCAKIVFWHFIE
jgi:hypothetical protein